MSKESKELLKSFGSNVFNEKAIRKYVSKETYLKIKESMEKDLPLEEDLAKILAESMKKWAFKKGATHYTHWFAPLNGITAEKHNSFIIPEKEGIVFDLPIQAIITGESDASSFPSRRAKVNF